MDLETAKPILFNTEMVKAILDGRKTVTRRVIKFPVNKFTEKYPDYDDISTYKTVCYGKEMDFDIKPHFIMTIKTPYCLGDILYVRETHYKDPDRYLYKANYSDNEKFYRDGQEVKIKWRPSIHMPKEAARIFLRVTDIRIERLQEIMEDTPGPNNQVVKEGCTYGGDFITVWDRTIKKSDYNKYGWNANPWVRVIEFKRMEIKE